MGSRTRIKKSKLKNVGMMTIRNATKQEVNTVFFPNGAIIRPTLKVEGPLQVAGIVNATEVRINGKSVTGLVGGSPFLFLDVDSNVFAFDSSSDTTASPSSIVLSALQVSQSSTLPITAFQVSGSDGTDLISHLGSHTVSETSVGNCVRTATLTYNDSAMRLKFPITTKVVHGGLTSTKKISKVEGGSIGSTGPAAVAVNLSADSTAISYDSSGANPSPSSITLTATSQNLTNGFFKFTGGGSSFSDETSYTDGTGANVDTATFTVPSSYSATPYTMRVGVSEADQSELAHDTLSIVSIKPGASGTTPATLLLDLDTNVISFDDSSDSTATPGTVSITVTQTGQASTLVAGDITAQNALGGSVTVSSFSVTATSTGNSVATAQISAPTNHAHYPVTITASNDGLTSSKIVAKAVGGSSATSIATTNVSFSVDLSSHSSIASSTNDEASTRITMVKGNTNGHARGYSAIGLNFSGVSGTNFLNSEAASGISSDITGLSFDERQLTVAIPNIANSSGTITNISGTVTLSDFRSNISGTTNVSSNLGFVVVGYISTTGFSSSDPTFDNQMLLTNNPIDFGGLGTTFPNFGTTKVVSFTATPNDAIDQDEMICFAIDIINAGGNLGKGNTGENVSQGIMDFNMQITYER